MRTRFFATIAAFLLPTTVYAATVDLDVDIVTAAPTYVYDTVEFEVVVSNLSNKRADDVELTIALPETNTSPTVHVMGTLGAIESRCTLVDTSLVCDLDRLRRNRSTTVTFELALPRAEQMIALMASVTTSDNDIAPGNDSDVEVPALLDYAVAVSPGDAAHNRHCTGQGLTSFFECMLFPSSLSTHDIEFLAGGELTIVGQPGYTGTWSQPTPETLQFSYETSGNVVAQFEGSGVSSDCFEGITTFPGSAYVAPYEVCL